MTINTVCGFKGKQKLQVTSVGQLDPHELNCSKRLFCYLMATFLDVIIGLTHMEETVLSLRRYRVKHGFKVTYHNIQT